MKRNNHPKDCTCAICATVRALEESLSEEGKIRAAWMVAVEKHARRKRAIWIYQQYQETCAPGDDKWDDALIADTEYHEASAVLVSLLIERFGRDEKAP